MARTASRHDRPTLAFIGFGEAAQGMAPGLLAGGRAHAPRVRSQVHRSESRAALESQGRVPGRRGPRRYRGGARGLGRGDLGGRRRRDAECGPGRGATPRGHSSVPRRKFRLARGQARGGGRDSRIRGGLRGTPASWTGWSSTGAAAPMVVSGPDAGALAVRLNALGMRIEAVGDEVGQASALKMLRGVLIKGLASLFVEALVAAHRLGVADKVIADIQKTIPGTDWRELATYHLGRVVLHARRRAAEMAEVAETLRRDRDRAGDGGSRGQARGLVREPGAARALPRRRSRRHGSDPRGLRGRRPASAKAESGQLQTPEPVPRRPTLTLPRKGGGSLAVIQWPTPSPLKGGEYSDRHTS